MEQGPLEETLIRRARVSREPIPEEIQNAPTILPGLEFYLQAFIELGSCRPIGMGEGRIPWTAAFDYATRQGLSSDEFEDLWQIVSLLDMAYLKHQQDKADRKQRAEEAKSRNKM